MLPLITSSAHLYLTLVPVPINHINLYYFSTCPGYVRYFYISDWQGLVGGYWGIRHIKRADGRARRSDSGDERA